VDLLRDEVEHILEKKQPRDRFSVVSKPEFLREGAAIQDFKCPDRFVIGTEDDWAKDAMTEIYRSFFLNESPILCAGRRTVELTKYGANPFLATKIIFINLIADLCEKLALTFRKFLVVSALITVLDQSFCMPGQNMAAAASPKTCWPL
tara:strand:- start:1565 stop:2011 length:447 start_codon:yes stop_codon:yes gene_type:complete